MSKPMSLPACAHRHPGVPSQIKVSVCTYRGEGAFGRRYCRVCKTLVAKEQELARKGLAAQTRPTALEDYGVIPLRWTPPERLLEVPCP